MAPFWKKAGAADEEAPAGVALPPSRLIADLLRTAAKRAASGTALRVLLVGPPSGTTIETFHGAGCRVTVSGDDEQSVSLDTPDGRYDLVLGFDALDRLAPRAARVAAAEWGRVLSAGGALFLLARRDRQVLARFSRIDVFPDGGLQLTPLGADSVELHPRQNREIEDLVKPLAVRDIFLRRDGLREIICRKA